MIHSCTVRGLDFKSCRESLPRALQDAKKESAGACLAEAPAPTACSPGSGILEVILLREHILLIVEDARGADELLELADLGPDAGHVLEAHLLASEGQQQSAAGQEQALPDVDRGELEPQPAAGVVLGLPREELDVLDVVCRELP